MNDFIMVSDLDLFESAKVKAKDNVVGNLFGIEVKVVPILKGTGIVAQICQGDKAVTLWDDGRITEGPRLDKW